MDKAVGFYPADVGSTPTGGTNISTKEYHRNYSKKWYEADKENKIIQRAVRREWVRRRNFLYLKELKESNPCTDCGRYYPYYVMHFDHLPGTSKIAGVSQMRTWSLKILTEEIAKCELVCANCHAVRTFSRLEITND